LIDNPLSLLSRCAGDSLALARRCARPSVNRSILGRWRACHSIADTRPSRRPRTTFAWNGRRSTGCSSRARYQGPSRSAALGASISMSCCASWRPSPAAATESPVLGGLNSRSVAWFEWWSGLIRIDRWKFALCDQAL